MSMTPAPMLFPYTEVQQIIWEHALWSKRNTKPRLAQKKRRNESLVDPRIKGNRYLCCMTRTFLTLKSLLSIKAHACWSVRRFSHISLFQARYCLLRLSEYKHTLNSIWCQCNVYLKCIALDIVMAAWQ